MSLLTSFPSWDSYVRAGGGRGLEAARRSGPDATISTLQASRLRGRGGGGFPTGDKWQAVRRTGTGTRYAVCNAAEGEPATFKDRLLLRRNPYLVLEGLAIAAEVVAAARAFVGLKRAFAHEIDSLSRAIDEMEDAGVFQGLRVDLVLGPDHYLFGEETGLLEVIEGKEPLPRVLAPYIQGLFADPPAQNPTLVNNVETLANVPHILAEGPEWLRSSGTPSSPGTMLFTLTGDVQTEGVFELPLGTPLRHLVEDIGKGPPERRSVKAIFPGASSTIITADQLDTPMDFDSMRQAGSGLGSAGFAVFDDSACMVQASLLYSRFLYVESCGQCPPCKFGSGEITAQLERIEAGDVTERDLDLILTRAKGVTDGQKCALPTGESLQMQSALQLFWPEFLGHVGGECVRPRRLAFPKLVEFDQETSTFVYDPTYGLKEPDWTYRA